jgi:hypothetical protein
MWILVAIFIVVTTLFRCNAFDMGGGGEDTGFTPPSSTSGQVYVQGDLAALPAGIRTERISACPLPISAGYSTMGITL